MIAGLLRQADGKMVDGVTMSGLLRVHAASHGHEAFDESRAGMLNTAGGPVVLLQNTTLGVFIGFSLKYA